MADKNRYVNTKFWTDNYISNLDPIEKLVFIYLLTNPQTNLLGIYEIPMKRIAFDTGIDKEMIDKILQRFDKDNKVGYTDGWIIIANFTKHQKFNPKTKIAVEEILLRVPDSVLHTLNRLSIGYIYLNLNSNINFNINSNINLNVLNSNYVTVEEKEWIEPTIDEFKNYINDNSLILDADSLYKYYKTGDWHDSKGNKVKNWKQKLLALNKYQKDKHEKKEFQSTAEKLKKPSDYYKNMEIK
jgi:hypothetical protein